MQVYKSKYESFPSTSHAAVIRLARFEYHKIQKRSPRREAYVRSLYFRKDKIFINQFWEHLKHKRAGDQVRRARLFACAIDLIRNTTASPDTTHIYADMHVSLHRFHGKTKDGLEFYVQIRANKRTGRKDFMSAFPAKNGSK